MTRERRPKARSAPRLAARRRCSVQGSLTGRAERPQAGGGLKSRAASRDRKLRKVPALRLRSSSFPPASGGAPPWGPVQGSRPSVRAFPSHLPAPRACVCPVFGLSLPSTFKFLAAKSLGAAAAAAAVGTCSHWPEDPAPRAARRSPRERGRKRQERLPAGGWHPSPRFGPARRPLASRRVGAATRSRILTRRHHGGSRGWLGGDHKFWPFHGPASRSVPWIGVAPIGR